MWMLQYSYMDKRTKEATSHSASSYYYIDTPEAPAEFPGPVLSRWEGGSLLDPHPQLLENIQTLVRCFYYCIHTWITRIHRFISFGIQAEEMYEYSFLFTPIDSMCSHCIISYSHVKSHIHVGMLYSYMDYANPQVNFVGNLGRRNVRIFSNIHTYGFSLFTLYSIVFTCEIQYSCRNEKKVKRYSYILSPFQM